MRAFLCMVKFVRMFKLTERFLFLKFVGILKFVKIREFQTFLKFIKFEFSICAGTGEHWRSMHLVVNYLDRQLHLKKCLSSVAPVTLTFDPLTSEWHSLLHLSQRCVTN